MEQALAVGYGDGHAGSVVLFHFALYQFIDPLYRTLEAERLLLGDQWQRNKEQQRPKS